MNILFKNKRNGGAAGSPQMQVLLAFRRLVRRFCINNVTLLFL